MLNFDQTLFLVNLLHFNSIYGQPGLFVFFFLFFFFFWPVYAPSRKWKEGERTVILMKLQRPAFSAVIWFGDLNAVAPRQ